MNRQRREVSSAIVAVLAIVMLIIGFGTAYMVKPSSTTTTTVTQTYTTTNSSTCLTTFPGQPLGASVRILNDSTSSPIVGAVVTATRPLGGSCSQTALFSTVQFTTNSSEWDSLPVLNGGTYQIVVTYLGQSYALTMPLGLSIYNCGTLFIPSGQTNVTTSTQTPCASTTSMSQSTNGHNTISVSGLSLCPSNCVYPAPYVSASVLINASVPISFLTVYVNNTYDGVAFENPSTTTIACTTGAGQTCSVELGGSGSSSGTSTTITKNYATCSVPANSTSCSATYTGSINTLTVFDYQYKGSVPSSFIPAVPGDTYVFKFVATFQDGSSATATASTVAG
jgi:hypothetical protein